MSDTAILVATARNDLEYEVHVDDVQNVPEKVCVKLLDADNLTRVLHTFMFNLSSELPEISTTFDVHLPLAKAVRKKVRYLNGYNESKQFTFKSSKPHIVQIVTETMVIGANAEVIQASISSVNTIIFMVILAIRYSHYRHHHHRFCLSNPL